eukprot:m.648919 g.648919  ORF g.648919 m.648919 type:complete len:339 (+) comp22663_c0_seq20:1422-2438(+)
MRPAPTWLALVVHPPRSSLDARFRQCDDSGAIARAGEEARGVWRALCHRLEQLLLALLVRQRHRAPAKATARHPRSVYTLHRHGQLLQCVQLWAAHFVVVPQRHVASNHQLAKLGKVGLCKRICCCLDSGNFGDDVARTLEHHVLHLGLHGCELRERGIPQAGYSRVPRVERPDRRLARGLALGVFAVAELVLDVAVGDQHHEVRVLHRHEACVERPTVNEQGMPSLAKRGDELVHDSTGHICERVLRPLACQCFFFRVLRLAVKQHVAKRVCCHFQRRRAGKTSPDWNTRCNCRIEPRQLWQLLHHALDVVCPRRTSFLQSVVGHGKLSRFHGYIGY